MKNLTRQFLGLLVAAASALSAGAHGQDKSVFASVYAPQGVELNTDPSSTFWQGAHTIFADVDPNGHQLPEYRTEIRSRWTKKYIYFLFVSPYHQLYLKPNPDAGHETYELWKWNVAEVFIGSDFKDIKHYKEFEVSPQNEWVDLDIDLHNPHHEDGWKWNSGFEHRARIDEQKQIWYAALRISFAALSPKAASAGTKFRVNFYRTEGPPDNSTEIMWQPVMSHTFHVPERFGLLRLSN